MPGRLECITRLSPLSEQASGKLFWCGLLAALLLPVWPKVHPKHLASALHGLSVLNDSANGERGRFKVGLSPQTISAGRCGHSTWRWMQI